MILDFCFNPTAISHCRKNCSAKILDTEKDKVNFIQYLLCAR